MRNRKQTRKIDRNWYNSRNVRPKTFHLEVERTVDGGYQIRRADMIKEINQHARTAQRVDLRDIVSDINHKGGIYAL